MKYGFIFEQQIFHPLRLLCRVLEVTKGGYLRCIRPAPTPCGINVQRQSAERV